MSRPPYPPEFRAEMVRLARSEEREELKQLRRLVKQLERGTRDPAKALFLRCRDGSIPLKYKAIEKLSAHHAVSVLRRVLHVQRFGFYAWRRGPSAHA